MSDTDDTEALLLIPPKLFVLDSSESEDSEETIRASSHCIVDDLINHVEQIECRLSRLDNFSYRSVDTFSVNSINSFLNRVTPSQGRCYDNKSNSEVCVLTKTNRKMSSPLKNKYEHYRDINKKPIDVQRYGSCNYSTDNPSICSDISTASALSTNQDNMMSEIDQFLKNVRGFENDKLYSKLHSDSFHNDRNQQDVRTNSDYIFKKDVQKQSFEVPSKLDKCNKINLINMLSPNAEKIHEDATNILQKHHQMMGTVSKDTLPVPTRTDNQYQPTEIKDITLNEQLKQSSKNVVFNTDDGCVETNTNITSDITENSNITWQSNEMLANSYPKDLILPNSTNFKIPAVPAVAHKKTCNIDNQMETSKSKLESLNPRRQFNLSCEEHRRPDNMHRMMSLDRLWNSEVRERDLHAEEEKLRREHCELEIHQLQTRLLELQEKLAVAVQVDRAKDYAITQLRNAWERLANHLEEMEIEQKKKINCYESDKVQLETERQEYRQFIQRHDEELARLTNFLKLSEEKVMSLEKNEDVLKKKLENQTNLYKQQVIIWEQRLNDAQQDKTMLLQQNQQLVESLGKIQNEMEAERTNSTECKNSLLKAKDSIENLTAELNGIKQERDTHKVKMKEERDRISHLETQKKTLQNSLDTSRVRENNLIIDIKNIKKQIEIQKKELKMYYQKQVETVVNEKLQEFQAQLETAEKSLESEAQTRERAVAERAAKQLQSVIHQNEMEIKLLEEKHKEEIELYRLQLSNCSKKNLQLQEKLVGYQNRRGQIAGKLHELMENQWKEALHIITSPADKSLNSPNLIPNTKELDVNVPSNFQNQETNISEKPSRDVQSFKPSSGYSVPSNSNNIPTHISTPTSSRGNPEQLQNYIKMLLNHSPNQQSLDDAHMQWTTLPQSTPINAEFSPESRNDTKLGIKGIKPPWK